MQECLMQESLHTASICRNPYIQLRWITVVVVAIYIYTSTQMIPNIFYNQLFKGKKGLIWIMGRVVAIYI